MHHPWLVALVLALGGSVSLSAAQDPAPYARARALIREGRFDQGIALLRPLLESEPRNLKALNLLGIALTGKGELAAANREFARALGIEPRFHPALKNLAVNELSLGDSSAAERHFTRAAQLAPADPVVHAHLGRIAFGRQDFALAAKHLALAGPLLAEDPTLAGELVQSYLETDKGAEALDALRHAALERAPPELRSAIAVTLARHDYFEQATPLFQSVHAQQPDSYDAGFNLAVCLVERRRFKEAIDLLRGMQERGHRTAELLNLLAGAFSGNQQTQEAIDVLREATRIAPEDENNYLDLAALCLEHEAYDLGLEVLDAGLRQRPQSDRLVFQRGIFHAVRGELGRAEESFQRAASLAPEKSLAHAGLGVVHMQSGDPQAAVQGLRQRAQERPDDHLLQYLLAKALLQSGAARGEPELEEARTALERSRRLNGRFAPSRLELGKLALKERRVNEAVAILEEALALDPRDAATCAQLGVAYLRQGKQDKAAALAATLARLSDEDWAREAHRRLRLVKPGAGPKD